MIYFIGRESRPGTASAPTRLSCIWRRLINLVSCPGQFLLLTYVPLIASNSEHVWYRSKESSILQNIYSPDQYIIPDAATFVYRYIRRHNIYI